MTPDEEKYYERYFDLFLTSGWKQFIEEMTDASSTYRLEDIKDTEHLYRSQGELSVLKRLLSFEEGIRNAYDYVLEQTTDVP